MTDWLTPVRAALDVATDTVPFFFRDDDAGWNDDALWRLLDRCHHHAVHIDVAVIPTEVTDRLAGELRDRAGTGLVHLHQHGFRHVNHESTGRKYEFGPSRSRADQVADIAAGRTVLNNQLPQLCDPVFTPPWNRCTGDTGEALVDLGFLVLSRDRSATPLNVSGLAEVPVTVDWFAKTDDGSVTPEQIGLRLADQVASRGAPIGVMLHHAVTDDLQLTVIDELLCLVGGHPSAVSTSIYNCSL
jgi:hypothetical protein